MSFEGTREEMQRLSPWFHNLHLPDGTETAPDHPFGDFPSDMWQVIEKHLPRDMRGMRALDVGCNAGFYSFELAKRGAKVVAIDHDSHYLAQAEWARRELHLESRVQLRQQDAYSLVGSKEKFDVVLFLGVFYHLRYPLLVLDTLALMTRRLLVFQTMTMPGDDGRSGVPCDIPLMERRLLQNDEWPKLGFIEHRIAGDPTNWWAPNPPAVEALLRSSGFRVTVRPAPEICICAPDLQNPSSFWTWGAAEYECAVASMANASQLRSRLVPRFEPSLDGAPE